ncbi:MAG TPA: 4-alpha-glucanotransferase [Alphaproteobacteria bacterium]|nr:4-alpha-glucanotransferase [Alphaproteobacteria bacterium]
MNKTLAELCTSHGVEPTYEDVDQREHSIPESTLEALVDIFGISKPADRPPDGIPEALAEPAPPQCYVPPFLKQGRAWGVTCQVPALKSQESLGMGDFRDLASFCGLAAAEGADFVGVNPLHALFWSDPGRISPFSPSNRRFLNPLYLVPGWFECGWEFSPQQRAEAERLNAGELVNFAAAAQLKKAILRALFAHHGKIDLSSAAYEEFRRQGGEPLTAHATFEALSEEMTKRGFGAGWPSWPEEFQDHGSEAVQAFVRENQDAISFHLWLQFHADRQLARVQKMALDAGMRIGLYVDYAVGAAPDGSAAWSDPANTVPDLSVGAPPDTFSATGQDWGLAPLSPVEMAEHHGKPIADALGAAVRHAGAIRIDHAMSLGRLWLIPRGRSAMEGAYVRYPLTTLLRRVAEVSQETQSLVIGEDLGTVPEGFREVIMDRELHSYKVWFFEWDDGDPPEPAQWAKTAIACIGTHDTNTFAGWWTGDAIDLQLTLGRLSREGAAKGQIERNAERAALRRRLGGKGADVESASLAVHRQLANSPCRLAALQIEDALCLTNQVNVPGTLDEYPNWRRRLPVPLERLGRHRSFNRHCAVFRARRPR